MSSITTQQTKLDLELVPKENRLEIKKCNGRIPHGLTPREPKFQVVLDAIALTPCYLAFLIIGDVPEVYMHQFWNSMYKHDTFYRFKIDKMKRFKLTLEIFKDIIQIFPRVPGRKFDALPSEEDTASFLRELGHTGEINSYNDVVVDQMHQPWRTCDALINRATLPECLTNLAMKENKAYKTYLSYATGAIPPKIARKFKKASPSKKDSDLVSVDEEPITKDKRVKRSVKKSLTNPTTGIVIIEPHVETKSNRKENVDVTRGKGIELLSEVALIEEAQMKEGNDEDDINDNNDLENEGNNEENKSNDDKTPFDSKNGLDSEQDMNGSESDSESDQQEYKEEVKDDDEDDKSEGDEDRGMDDTPNQFSDDVQDNKESKVPDASFSHSSDLASKFLNFLNIHPNDAEIISSMDVHVHHEVPRIHTSTLLTVPVSVIPEASLVCTTIPQSSQNFTSSLLQTTPTPPPMIKTASILSIILDFTLVFRFNKRVIALEQDVAKLKKDPLHTQVTALVDDHLDIWMGATREEFMNFLSASPTDRITEQRSRQEKDKDEGPSAGSDRGFKKIDKQRRSPNNKKTDYLEELEFEVGDTDTPQGQDRNLDKTPQKGPTQNWLMNFAASTSTDKSLKDFDELMSTPINFSLYILNGLKIKNLTQEILLGPAFRLLKGTRSNYAELEYDFEECYKALSEKLDWENPKGGNYPFDLSKPLPLITRGNRQRIQVKFFINNDPKLIRSDELYKFSDGTLTRLISSLEDITKNIDKEYLPKRTWSTLEKKRAYFMIKDINKLLKERRMMRSLEKFIGGRLYKTDIRLLQRRI
uniref:Uncharacterized protein n=1 Tax=Tanacetum cinerariifolium TaxID=118510 RepID=A0A6L2L826_TANCI|nr:hypothetical protein [Tanacetum cinerariifolium]